MEKPEIQQQDALEANIDEAKKIDTVHQDEAMKVLATYGGDQHWTDQEEKALVRKIDLRLMPILIATYGLQYYDKAMMAQAACPAQLHQSTRFTKLGRQSSA